MDINKKVMMMEADTYELVKQASRIFGYSKDLEERLHLCLLSHMYQKHIEEGIDYNDLLCNMDYQTTTVPIVYEKSSPQNKGKSALIRTIYECGVQVRRELIYTDLNDDPVTIALTSLYHELEHLLTSFHIEKELEEPLVCDRRGFKIVKMKQFKVYTENEQLNETVTLNEELSLPKIVSKLGNYSLRLINIEALKRLIPTTNQILVNSGYKNIYKIALPFLNRWSHRINKVKYYGGVKEFETDYNKEENNLNAFRTFSTTLDSAFIKDIKEFQKQKRLGRNKI